MRYYESHVTMVSNGSVGIPRIKRECEDIGWKFSMIAGDIVLGDEVKMYATRHFNARFKESLMVEWLHETADRLARLPGVTVERRKVEMVIYDDRSSKVKPCDGACAPCHLDDLKQAAI